MNKHHNPNKTTITISAIILVRLKKLRIDNYTNLKKFVLKKQNGSEPLLLPSLSLLFLLGLVEYKPKTDSVEYIGP